MASLRGCPKALASEGMWRGHGDREKVFKLKRYFSLLYRDRSLNTGRGLLKDRSGEPGWESQVLPQQKCLRHLNSKVLTMTHLYLRYTPHFD